MTFKMYGKDIMVGCEAVTNRFLLSGVGSLFSFHSEMSDWYQTKSNCVEVFILHPLFKGTLNGLLPIVCLCTSQKLLMVLYFSQ